MYYLRVKVSMNLLVSMRRGVKYTKEHNPNASNIWSFHGFHAF